MSKSEEERIFREAVNGYGFQEVEQTSDGTFCTGCHVVHKRPTKMYTLNPGKNETLCRFQVVNLYNPEGQYNGY